MRIFLTLSLVLLTHAGCATTATREAAPVATVGIAFTAEGELGTFAEGPADPAARRAVTPDDPVRIASVSKLPVAIGVMKLVEARKLGLDADVSRYLGWTLRNPAFPDRPITLRMLLSHTSSLRDHDDRYAIPFGGSVRQVLGEATSWDRANPPGAAYFAYSNMNFPVIASIVERVTGERFDRWMHREVLSPLRLDACYNWPTCSDAAVGRAIVLTQDGKAVRDDLQGVRPECPVFVREGEPCDLSRWRPGENGAIFSPQGGLRISARGLARIGRMLLNGGELDGVRVISPASVDLILEPNWRFTGRNGSRAEESANICAYGLASQEIPGTGCDDDLGRGGAVLVGHAGDAYGLRSGLWLDRTRRRGVAYFVTGIADGPSSRSSFSAAEQRAFRRAYALLPR